jgi:hypothetical protein
MGTCLPVFSCIDYFLVAFNVVTANPSGMIEIVVRGEILLMENFSKQQDLSSPLPLWTLKNCIVCCYRLFESAY